MNSSHNGTRPHGIEHYASRVAIEPHPRAGSHLILVTRNPAARAPIGGWWATVRAYYRFPDHLILEEDYPVLVALELEPIYAITRRGAIRSARRRARAQGVYDLPVFDVEWQEFHA
jgi:hypothetical protein